MKIYIKIITITISLLIMSGYGCTSNQPNVSKDLQGSFKRLVAVEDVNESLRVRVDSSDKDKLKFDSDIHVVIENLSNGYILIPEPAGIKLLVIRNNEWIEIDDAAEYYGNNEGPILYPAGPAEMRDQTSTWIHPILKPGIEKITGQEILRIVVIGELKSDDEKTGNSVGAYVDVFVNP